MDIGSPGPSLPAAHALSGSASRGRRWDGGTRAAGSDPAPERILDAARQFEALLITQLLRAAKSSDNGGWLGAGEDSSASSAMEFAEEQFAAMLSSQGGLGMAKLIAEGLERRNADVKSAAEGEGQKTGPSLLLGAARTPAPPAGE